MGMVIGYNPSIHQRLHARDRVAYHESLRYLPSLVSIWCQLGGTLNLGSERLMERVGLLAASTSALPLTNLYNTLPLVVVNISSIYDLSGRV
jgi:hypothetical protein